jgi:hypothetical protein
MHPHAKLIPRLRRQEEEERVCVGKAREFCVMVVDKVRRDEKSVAAHASNRMTAEIFVYVIVISRLKNVG